MTIVRGRFGRILAVLAVVLVIAGSAVSDAEAATSRPFHCIVALKAFQYAMDQADDAVPGSDYEEYWTDQAAYWGGYIAGADC